MWRAALVVGIASAMLALPASALAEPPPGPAVFFKVVYQGSGHYVVNGSASCQGGENCFTGPIHQDLALTNWKATYPAVRIGFDGASGTADAANQQLDANFEGTDTDCDSSDHCENQDCFATYVSDPGAPPVALSGAATGDSLRLTVDAPWHPMAAAFTCLPIHMPDPVLPDTLRAVTTIPFSAFDKGTVTKSVSSTDPGTYLTPPDCTAEAHADNSDVTECTRSANWSGTLTITPDCVSGTASGAPWCIKKKEKDDWSQAAKDWRARQTYLDDIATASECTKAGTANADFENKWNCAVQNVARGTAKSMAQADQNLADDPPDMNYDEVAQPGAASLARLGPLKKHAHNFVTLERRYARAASLMRALLVSQDRATGAFFAMSEGADASGALAKQNAAVLRYARKAAALLNGQGKIAPRAARELRGHHGKRSKKVAALLVNRQATREDSLTARGLSAIGR